MITIHTFSNHACDISPKIYGRTFSKVLSSKGHETRVCFYNSDCAAVPTNFTPESGDYVICDGNLDHGDFLSENLISCAHQHPGVNFIFVSANAHRVQNFKAAIRREGIGDRVFAHQKPIHLGQAYEIYRKINLLPQPKQTLRLPNLIPEEKGGPERIPQPVDTANRDRLFYLWRQDKQSSLPPIAKRYIKTLEAQVIEIAHIPRAVRLYEKVVLPQLWQNDAPNHLMPLRPRLIAS